MSGGRHLAFLRTAWVLAILTALYLPIASVVLASLANTRYMRFPHRVWTLDAYARYDWKGRSLFQRALVLPIFFPQPVLGLALLLSFSAVGIAPSWQTAIVAHLVWIVPIVTLVISIRLFGYDPAQEEAAFDLGASRWQVAREVTLPVLWPGIFSGALFAFLLSWSNLPLSAYTSGADTPLPVWLFTRTATNYSPLVPAVAVIGTVVSALIVLALVLLRRLAAR